MTHGLVFTVEGGVLSIADEGQRVAWVGLPDGLPVLDLKLAQDASSAFVLLDPPPGSGRVHNLIKVAGRGEVLWRGELPRQESTDAFVSLQVADGGQVLAGTWSGHLVRLNPGTGRIEGEVFTK